MTASSPLAAPGPAEVKRSLRARMKRLLGERDPAPAAIAARRLAEHVLNLPEVIAAEHLLACLSFGREIDTWELIERLRKGGKRVFVPRAWRHRRHLTVHAFPCPLEVLDCGLRQPREDTAALAAERVDQTLDAALVLGLAFDPAGSRLGFGAGYFDRFLAGRRFPAIGLAFADQLVERLPTEDHDVAMTAVVTDAGVLRP